MSDESNTGNDGFNKYRSLESMKRHQERYEFHQQMCHQRKSAEEEERQVARERILNNLDNWIMELGYAPYTAIRASKGFESWDINDGNSGEVLKTIKSDLGQHRPIVFGWWLCGLEGTGKTGMSARIVVELIKRYPWIKPEFVKYIQFPMWYKSYLKKEVEEQYEKIQELFIGVQVIVIDELLKNPTESMFEIVRSCFEEWEKRNTIVIIPTNWMPKTLENQERKAMCDRAAPTTRRILELLTVIEMTGTKYNSLKA